MVSFLSSNPTGFILDFCLGGEVPLNIILKVCMRCAGPKALHIGLRVLVQD